MKVNTVMDYKILIVNICVQYGLIIPTGLYEIESRVKLLDIMFDLNKQVKIKNQLLSNINYN